MKKIIILIVIGLLPTIKTTSQNISQSSWNDYTGSHYKTQPWGGWVRDYSRKTGSYILDSGLVYGQIDTNLINTLFNDLMVLPTKYDVMLQTNGLGSARDTGKVNLYLRRIEADSGRIWKELCRQEALKLAGLQHGKDRIFWQVGNEISSPAYSQQLHLWDGSPVPGGGNGIWYDQFVIPIYVEYYLAPSVEGINAASMQLFGSPDSINICLGSLTNAGGQGASIWLDSLMNYTIKGTYAPTLVGKKVYELVDIITIHYMMGTASTDSWKSKIDGYRNRWFGIGKIKGIWSTEEVGINAAEKGKGAIVGAITTSRYLEWAILNNYTPYQCRTNYYASETGPVNTTVSNLNQEIYNFLDSSSISLVSSNAIIYDNPQVESHAFLSSDSTRGVIYTFLKGSTMLTGSVSKIKITGYKMGNIRSATSHYFSSAGHQVFTPTITASLDTFIVDMISPVKLDSTNYMLVTLIRTVPFVTTSIVGERRSPYSFELEQNYPNPFNPSTTINFSLPKTGYATLKVFDILGREVSTLVDGEMTAGKHSILFNAMNLPSSIYFYQLIAGDFRETKKMILVK